MAYSPNPQDPTQPTISQLAGNMAYELQALKGYIQSLVSSGTNFAYIGGSRNRFNNGDFSIAQRGVSGVMSAGTHTYILDQWILNSVGGTTTWGQGVGSSIPSSNYLNLAGATGNTASQLSQRIESLNCQDLVAGTPVTISGFLDVNNLSAITPSINLSVPTATDNWTSTTVAAAPQTVAISVPTLNTWQFFSNTFILTADAVKGLQVTFSWGSSSLANVNVSLGNFQLEKGSVHTQFEYRPTQTKLALCERYYQIGNCILSVYATGGASGFIAFPLTSTMRVAPAIVSSASGGGNYSSVVPACTTGMLTLTITATATGAALFNYSFSLSAEL
jgi:hypothetical protein